MHYKIKRGGQEFGPYSLADLKRYVSEGRIAPTDLAKSEGMDDWAFVSQVTGTMEIPQPALSSVPGVGLGGIHPSMLGPDQPTARSSLFAPFVRSFFSADLYREAAERWPVRRAVVYLLLLVSLCWLPFMFQMDAAIRDYVENELPELIADFPAIRISGGEASVDAPQPYIIQDPDTGKPLAILDTTGEITSLEDTDARLLLTKDKLFVENDNQTRIFDLSQMDGLELDRSSLEYFFGLMSPWFAIGMYPILVAGTYAYRLVVVVFYALIGLIVAKVTGAALDFQALFRVAAIAITPVYLLNTVLSLLKVQIPVGFLISMALVVVYLVFGVRSAKPVALHPAAMAAGAPR